MPTASPTRRPEGTMTERERQAERRGYWQGAILVAILWTIDNVAHPAFWLLFLLALALGTIAGLLSRWTKATMIEREAK
jgi:hypothetical protein